MTKSKDIQTQVAKLLTVHPQRMRHRVEHYMSEWHSEFSALLCQAS